MQMSDTNNALFEIGNRVDNYCHDNSLKYPGHWLMQTIADSLHLTLDELTTEVLSYMRAKGIGT